MNSPATLDSPSGKRARAKAANRQAILEAARAVFARIGYDATTVRDIIRETDLAAGTFYNYFRSKEEVFEALAVESTRRFRPRLKEVRERATDFESFIEGAYRAYFDFLAGENEDAIRHGAPHMALIGVRVDTPEMQVIFEDIRADIERMLDRDKLESVDTEYLTAAAVGIARELGDHMLKRRPIDVDEATRFATQLLKAGLTGTLGDVPGSC
ncbi:MAG: TetR/AcrR family transcriptional regulator [Pseudomonadota bacterium]